MRIVVRRGLSIRLAGEPEQSIDHHANVAKVGLRGQDLGPVRAEVLVEADALVAAGAPLFRDRTRPDIVFVSPVSGTVERIEIGARRRLSEIIIAADGSANIAKFDSSNIRTRDGMRALLLAAGQWPALRSRPFERIADPDVTPSAIFITAIDTAPHAPDPLPIIEARRDDFRRGVEAMTQLVDGPVYLCQPDVAPLVQETGRLKTVRFAGLHPAGLVGTHIARLHRPSESEPVWHIGYQDVIAIGHLLETGTIDPFRIVAIAGPGMRRPRLVRVPLGADLHALTRPDLAPGPKAIVSGSVLSGTEGRFLARYHLQATVIERKPRPSRHWLIEALDKAQMPAPFIPTQALENALGTDAPVVPLLRALSIGDAEAAQRFGCFHLAEDDLALARYVTGGQTDFGKHLRAVLDSFEERA